MAVTLTSEQRDVVTPARKNPRPNYFNGTTGTQTEITQDFEAFLILRGKNANATTVDWLSKSVEFFQTVSKRDGLLNEFLTYDAQDVAAVLAEVTEELEEFNTFRENFEAGAFSEAPETSLLLGDMQKLADEIFTTQERAVHLSTIHAYIRERSIVTQGLSTSDQRQIQSWIEPLLAY